MKINVIITGATGMVGKGVLLECLESPEVDSVLAIVRSSTGLKHARLKELIPVDFYNLSGLKSNLKGFQACFFCLGVSALGLNEEQYTKITYQLTLHFARTLLEFNPGMVFNYVSGTGTDSTEKGRSMWARVKGKTENDLMKLPFKDSFMFRPGFIQPTKGLKNTYTMYKILTPIIPLLRKLFPKYVTTLKEIGLAMINVTISGSAKKVLECKDIIRLAKK